MLTASILPDASAKAALATKWVEGSLPGWQRDRRFSTLIKFASTSELLDLESQRAVNILALSRGDHASWVGFFGTIATSLSPVLQGYAPTSRRGPRASFGGRAPECRKTSAESCWPKITASR